MKDFLAVVGVVLLILCGLLSLVTVQTGGVRHVDEAGRTTEVLTWQGWQPAGAQPEPPAPTPVPAVAVVQPTWPPAPPVAPTAAPPRSSPVPLVADAGGGTGDNGAGSSGMGASGVTPGEAISTAEPAITRLSPWEVLGWTLAGLVPASSVSALALLVHRQIALTRARAAALRAALGGPAMAPGASSEPPEPREPPAEVLPVDDSEEGVETDVAVFLQALTAPPAGAAGGGR